MSARITQEGVLPEVRERREILERAGTVLEEARLLLESLDQTGGRLNVRSARVLSLQRPITVSLSQSSEIAKSVRWTS
jgi:hypothetical protein